MACFRSSAAPFARRGFLLAALGAVGSSALAQVDVGESSQLRNLVPAESLERAATQQYAQMMAQARQKNALAPENHPQLQRLRFIAQRLIPFTAQWNPRARGWRWEINLIGSKQINAFCMPGGKIAFYTGILEQLKLTDDEVAMVMGHEMAHALREHARERIAKTQGTNVALNIGAQLLGLGQYSGLAANVGTHLAALKFSRSDETEADLVGLELGARGGYDPQAAVTLWQKMQGAKPGGGGSNISWFSTHPSSPDRIKQLQANVPKVRALYQAAPRPRPAN